MKRNNKGFTLAELLIVIAIIGILVAMIILTLSNSLEKAREATDLANIRTGCAELMDAASNMDSSRDYVRVFKKDGKPYCYCLYIKTAQSKDGWQSTNLELSSDGYAKMSDFYITAPYTASGKKYNVYQVKYYVDEQTPVANSKTNTGPYHFQVIVISEASVGNNKYYGE